ncbi:MAG: hypothetical protein AAF191_12880 [Verrucomicrobiota bacterium]
MRGSAIPVVWEVGHGTHAKLTEVAPQFFLTSWEGEPVSGMASFRLLSDATALWFWMGVGTEMIPSFLEKGAFVEGLWEDIVMELFLGQKGESAYEEWNLGRGGAWWHQGFSSYRERARASSAKDLPGVSSGWWESDDRTQWAGLLRFPWERKQLGNLVLQVSGISVHPESGRKSHFASVEIPNRSPDFHLLELFPQPIFKRMEENL